MQKKLNSYLYLTVNHSIMNILWNEVVAYDFDHPLSEYSFSVRLAKENFWTHAFTAKTIVEYKKFMYLAATVDAMVSPSEIVDVVWHQHLVFTQSYTDFCRLLGKTIQHIPSTHNRQDAARFKQAKERTNKMYKSIFGEPPADVWEYATMHGALQLPKSTYKLRSGILVGLFILAVWLITAYFLLQPFYLTINGNAFLPGYIALWVVSLLALAVYNHMHLEKLVNGFRKCFIHELEPAELIYLKSGEISDVVYAALDRLIKQNKVSVKGTTLAVVEPAKAATTEEFTIIESLTQRGPLTYDVLLRTLASKPVFANVCNAMDALQKYTNKSTVFTKLFYLNFGVLGFVLSLGLVRLALGLLREKPVGLLMTVLLLGSVIGLYALWRLSKAVTQQVIPKFYRAQIVPTQKQYDNSNWDYFLLGSAAFTPALLPIVRRSDYGSGNSYSDSSSCSSCGGCGGGD
jgi:uncharacterized protein (TIGR04222 family)